jgi:hypothetical protein
MRRIAGFLFVACLSCAPRAGDPSSAGEAATSRASRPFRRHDKVALDAPFVRQKPDFCGEACVEMATARLGRRLSQDAVFELSGVDPSLGRGAYTPELKTAIERAGFDPGPVWQQVEAARAGDEIDDAFDALHRDLTLGVPSIVCMHYDERPDTTEHFRLVTGYDPDADEVVYNEPAEDGGAARRMPRTRFLALWPLKYRASTWTLIRFRMRPAHQVARASASAGRFGGADFAQHVLALRRRIGPAFVVVVEPPFVVVGDEPADRVRERARNTVRWATDKLKADYFAKDPNEILDVFLFRDAASYDHNARVLFDDRPTTPYGYYSSRHKALVMNIATGGGTLVHEIVHPFVEANLPDCPAWLNEGLGSLYEQSGEHDGHIVGYLNWRLPGLKRAIAAGATPRLEKLMSLDPAAFYADESGVHYAAARYLLYYLQSKNLLVRYFKEYAASRAADPSGVATLRRLLGESDLDAFEERWKAFVAKL